MDKGLKEPQEIVICAAVKATDGTIIRCHRHDMGIRELKWRDLIPGHHDEGQGFITSRNRYVNRAEGLALQLAAGVASVDPGGYRGGELYSEDLY